MHFHKNLLETILIQANQEESGWHTSNYSLMKVSQEQMHFFDYEENLIQSFNYRVDKSLNIVLKPDQTIFGKIHQQNETRLDILQEDGQLIHFIKAPDTAIHDTHLDFDEKFKESRWTTQQLGFQLNFKYVQNHCLEKYKQNTGLPGTEINDSMEFNFTIVNPFGKWFLLMFADQIMVDTFPIHKIQTDTIELYATLFPQTIRVLKRVQ